MKTQKGSEIVHQICCVECKICSPDPCPESCVKYQHALRDKIVVDEDELQEHILRLLQPRAGGRYTMFEAGMLYQSCLTLGLKDNRPGKIGEQENRWEDLVCSFRSIKEAEDKLKEILGEEDSSTKKKDVKNYVFPDLLNEERGDS